MNRSFLIVILLFPALVACTSAPLQPAEGGPTVKGDGRCDAAPVSWAVGQKADEQVMKKVWQQSGAGLIRPMAPGQVVTLDFRQDRINVHLDADNTITHLDCG
ncbi:MAG: I78 family peptidase inhibitor [Pseudoxanthomonas sp.]